jgi:hypothetical protein
VKRHQATELEQWRAEAIGRRIEVALLRELVVSMALGISREMLPDSERRLLDEIVGGPTPGEDSAWI